MTEQTRADEISEEQVTLAVEQLRWLETAQGPVVPDPRDAAALQTLLTSHRAQSQHIKELREALERIAAMGDRVVHDEDGPTIVCCHPRELEEPASIARSALTDSSTGGSDE